MGFFSIGEIMDSLRVGRNWPEVRERLTILLVIIEMSMDEHSLRSQMGMGSELDCLFGLLDRILRISDYGAGVKTEKSEGVAGGEGECGDDVAGSLVREFQVCQKTTNVYGRSEAK